MKITQGDVEELTLFCLVIFLNILINIFKPLVVIWAINNLFKTTIDYSLWNWWVIFATITILTSTAKFKTK
jgi:hypothetical protein